VVVDNFDLMGIFFKPEEADTPLVIEPAPIGGTCPRTDC
jgi:hypothetical protein